MYHTVNVWDYPWNYKQKGTDLRLCGTEKDIFNIWKPSSKFLRYAAMSQENNEIDTKTME